MGLLALRCLDPKKSLVKLSSGPAHATGEDGAFNEAVSGPLCCRLCLGVSSSSDSGGMDDLCGLRDDATILFLSCLGGSWGDIWGGIWVNVL